MSTQLQSFEKVVFQAMPQFERIAAGGKMVKWAEESQFALQALSKNEILKKCVPETIQNAVINVAAVGLTLNPADGYAYLVPEYNKTLKANECHLRISFKGLVKVATDTGCIKWVRAEIVKQNDQFTYKGPAEMPEHAMNPFGDRGDTVGVYCVAKTNDGDYLTDIMSIDEINKIKSCAKTQMVWQNWFDEMAKKAIIKRAAKQWPKSGDSSVLHKAVEVINETEGGTDPLAHLDEIAAEIADLIDKDDLVEAGRVWCECDEQEQSALWVAQTKGGWFNQLQKTKIREACTAYRESESIVSEQ